MTRSRGLRPRLTRVVHEVTEEQREGGYRFVPLGRGRFAKVDASDFDEISRHTWHVLRRPDRITDYAIRRAYDPATQKTSPVLMHRQIVGAARGVQVDHANSDGLDNRRVNLRPCSHSQNVANRPPRNATGFKGVRPLRKRFTAEIRVDGRSTHIGVFDTAEEAARAYDAVALRLHGLFARLNFAPDAVRELIAAD